MFSLRKETLYAGSARAREHISASEKQMVALCPVRLKVSAMFINYLDLSETPRTKVGNNDGFLRADSKLLWSNLVLSFYATRVCSGAADLPVGAHLA